MNDITIKVDDDIQLKIIKHCELSSVIRASEGVFTYDNKTNQDYLPQYFPKWSQASNHYLYGLYVKGELVALKCDTILDNGKTLFAQGLRVSKHHRNCGYAAKLHHFSGLLRQRVVVPRYSINKIRYAKGVHDRNIKKLISDTANIGNSSEMCTRTGFTASFNQTNSLSIFSQFKHMEDGSFSIISATDAWHFASTYPELFKQNVIYTDWEAHDITLDNFLLLGTGGYGNFERKFLLFQCNDGHKALGIFGYTPRGVGTALVLDIFTNRSLDISLFCNYIISNLPTLKTSYSLDPPDHIWCWIPYHLEPSNEFQSVLSLLKNNPTHYWFHCVYFEDTSLEMLKHPLIPKSKL